MPLPPDLTTIVVTASYYDLSGAPQQGYVSFSYPGIIKDATGRAIFDVPVTAQVNGAMTPVTLPCNDSAGIVPQGFQLTVTERIGSSVNSYAISLPSTLGAAVDLSALAPAAPVPAASSFATPNTWTGTQTFAGSPPMIIPGGTAGEVLTSDSAGNLTLQAGGSSAVTSVNGKTGTVVLAASDVGADASGAAAAAQAAAQTYASGLATTETGRAETAEGLAAQKAANLSDLASAATARTNLGLGSAATQASSAFDGAGAAATETTRAQAAEALLAPKASPALTGTPTAPTASALDNTTKLATTAYADSAVGVETARATTAEALKAPLASPALTGSPTAPTQTAGDSSTKIATDAFVATAVAAETTRATTAEALALPKAGGTMSGVIAMGSNKITGGVAGVAGTDFATVSQIPASLPPNGTAGGALSGTYPNPGLAVPEVLTGTSGTAVVFETQVTGDTNPRTTLNAGGGYAFGPGNAAVDTNLYRNGPGLLQTDTALTVGGLLTADGGLAMASTKVTGLANGSATTDAATYGQLTTETSRAEAAEALALALAGGTLTGPLTLAADPAAALQPATKQYTDTKPPWSYLMPTGAITETFSRLYGGIPVAAHASGTLFLSPLVLEAGVPVGHLAYQAEAANASATHWWFALFNSSFQMLATTADQLTASWAIGAASLAIATTAAGSATSYTPTYTGLYYIGEVQVATTPAILTRAATVTAGCVGLVSPILSGSSSTGQTAPPSFPFTAAALTSGTAGAPDYAYVSS